VSEKLNSLAKPGSTLTSVRTGAMPFVQESFCACVFGEGEPQMARTFATSPAGRRITNYIGIEVVAGHFTLQTVPPIGQSTPGDLVEPGESMYPDILRILR
jgi:hypothetical protein